MRGGRSRRSNVAGGLALGLALTFVVSLFTFSSMLGRVDLPWWLLVPSVSLPLLGLLLLIVPGWRRAGAGFVLGLAIGSVVFGGVCGALYAAQYQSQQQDEIDRDGPVPP